MRALLLSLFVTAAVVGPLDDLLVRAREEKKPIVVFYRAEPCDRCPFFERALEHPAIQRRLPNVVFATLPAPAGELSGVVLYDRAGTARARWPIVPGTASLGLILDSAIAVGPHFERAVQLAESGQIASAEASAAVALAMLGRNSEARAALANAQDADPETVKLANKILDANEGHPTETAPARVDNSTIRILPFAHQVLSGRQNVQTRVGSASVGRVKFFLDGREVAHAERPPFSAKIDFGEVPERRSLRVVAFDRKGVELGRNEVTVNEGGETFWLRLVEPREGPAGGAVHVAINLRAPVANRVRRLVVSWNEAERAVLTAAPWEAKVRIPSGQAGVLRAVAELDDGRTSEDAVLLNASGYAGAANVQLVQLPITALGRNGAAVELTPEQIVVREGNKRRVVESVATAAETPLTIGLLIDTSDSMFTALPDVQEAAMKFLETILTPRDRAFLITFDSRARLVQPATSDLALLRRRIVATRTDGLTALNDAMALGLLQFEGVNGRRAMVVFSDGFDMTSQYKGGEVAELARRTNVPIHIIAAIPDVASAIALRRTASTTGGTFHILSALSELPAVYARIDAALRAQLLAFVRTDPATRENDWRDIRVEVAGHGIEVFAPEGYYAGW